MNATRYLSALGFALCFQGIHLQGVLRQTLAQLKQSLLLLPVFRLQTR
jgi:hypothetical protein